MVDRTASVPGNWSASATWGGAAPPTGSQTWQINAGVAVVLDADPGALTGAGTILGTLTPACTMTTGTLGSITISGAGKLYASRSLTSFLRVVGTITTSSPNGVDYGVETTDPIPSSIAAAIEFVCTSDSQSSRGIVLGANDALTMCGATRVQSSTLASLASIGANTIVLAENMALRPGTLAQAWAGLADFIIVGHTPTQTGNGAQNDEIDIYLVAGYDPVTKTVTLGDAGLGDSNWPRGGVTATWNTIHQTDRQISTPVTLAGANAVLRGSAYNLRPARGMDGNYRAAIKRSLIAWCASGIYYGSGHTISGNTISGNSSGINYGSGHTISGNTIAGNTYGILYGSGHIISANTIAGNSNGIYSGSGHTISANTIAGNSSGINSGSGHTISGNTISGNSSGINYGSGHTIQNNIGSGNTNYLYALPCAEMRNNLFSGVEHSQYNQPGRLAWHYVASENHNQIAGAWKAWCRGGIVTKAANVVPPGKAYSYEHACEGATSPCFRQLVYTMKRYEKLHYRTYVRKEVSMTYRPRIQIIDFFADPLVDAANVALAETIMTDSSGTWEVLDVYYFNNSDMPKKVLLRTLAKDASGVVYFYPSIILNSDCIVTCDSEGMV